MTEHPFGLFVSTDPLTEQTDIPGVWTDGNSSDLSAMVGAAALAARRHDPATPPANGTR
jgi:hypothetical protein